MLNHIGKANYPMFTYLFSYKTREHQQSVYVFSTMQKYILIGGLKVLKINISIHERKFKMQAFGNTVISALLCIESYWIFGLVYFVLPGIPYCTSYMQIMFKSYWIIYEQSI